MVLRTLIMGAKRVPLIKFRKGGNQTAPSSGSKQTSPVRPVPVNNTNNSNAIEDWELPRRFARKPITSEEMEHINRGGPA